MQLSRIGLDSDFEGLLTWVLLEKESLREDEFESLRDDVDDEWEWCCLEFDELEEWTTIDFDGEPKIL